MTEWIAANWETAVPILLSAISLIYTSIVWKKQKKLDDGLARSKAAYDIILKKEFDYYENIDPIYAKLIPGVQDIAASLQNSYPKSLSVEDRKVIAKREMLVYAESIVTLKSFLQSNDIYLPFDISKACGEPISLMQDSVDFFHDEMKKLWDETESEIDKEQCKQVADSIVYSYAKARSTIKHRLDILAKI